MCKRAREYLVIIPNIDSVSLHAFSYGAYVKVNSKSFKADFKLNSRETYLVKITLARFPSPLPAEWYLKSKPAWWPHSPTKCEFYQAWSFACARACIRDIYTFIHKNIWLLYCFIIFTKMNYPILVDFFFFNDFHF